MLPLLHCTASLATKTVTQLVVSIFANNSTAVFICEVNSEERKYTCIEGTSQRAIGALRCIDRKDVLRTVDQLKYQVTATGRT